MFHIKQKLENESSDDGNLGGSDNDWKTNLPESIQGWNEVKEAKSPEAFWDQVGNMRSFMGQSIRVPTEDASKEAKAEFNQKLMEKVPNLMQKPDFDDNDVMDQFYEQMGRPKESTAYSVPEMKAPDGIVLQEGLPEAFKDIAYKNGLTQKQYEGVVKDYTETTVHEAEEQLAGHRQEMKSLHDEWGVKFDSNIEKAEAIRSKYFSNVVSDINMLGADGVRAFTSIAEKFGKEGAQELIASQQSEHSTLVAPAEAQNRLDEILTNNDHAYWHSDDPAHQRSVDKVVELTKLANPKLSRTTDNMMANSSVEIG